jgi:hypothetical protein
MRLDRVSIGSGSIPFHPRLTVVLGVDAEERAGLVAGIVDAVSGSARSTVSPSGRSSGTSVSAPTASSPVSTR